VILLVKSHFEGENWNVSSSIRDTPVVMSHKNERYSSH